MDLKASHESIARPCTKIIYNLDVVAFICNLNTWKMDTIRVRCSRSSSAIYQFETSWSYISNKQTRLTDSFLLGRGCVCVLGKHVEVREQLTGKLVLSPPTTWILRINLRMPGLVVSGAFTH